jgi:hypothetical protein
MVGRQSLKLLVKVQPLLPEPLLREAVSKRSLIPGQSLLVATPGSEAGGRSGSVGNRQTTLT